jgi:hypothetical protein
LLLNINDIPSEMFDTKQNLSFLTGAEDQTNDEVIRRAREMGSITVWRKMRNERSRRALWVELIPFANRDDAEAAVNAVMSDLRGMPLAPSMENRKVNLDGTIIEGVTHFVAIEQRPTDPTERIGALILTGAQGNLQFALGFESRAQMWSWEEAIPIVELQLQKIRLGKQESR